jgi:hypothetical protein
MTTGIWRFKYAVQKPKIRREPGANASILTRNPLTVAIEDEAKGPKPSGHCCPYNHISRRPDQNSTVYIQSG